MNLFLLLTLIDLALVFASGIFVMLGPSRQARRCAQRAHAAHLLGEDAHLVGDYDQAGLWWLESDTAWKECFAWHALSRRIQRPVMWIALGFAVVANARWIFA